MERREMEASFRGKYGPQMEKSSTVEGAGETQSSWNMGGYDRLWSSKHRRRSTKYDLCLDGRCKDHPGHLQSPGVCSLCLSEKLYRLQRSLSSRPPRGGSSIGSFSSSISTSLPSFYSCSSGTLDSSTASQKGKGESRTRRWHGSGSSSHGRNQMKASSNTGAGG
ncbi:hypothetical protein MLD38_001022 [Melastoma candidum]|uniref:Uncharacterized protein n=1 Tax=Melastoma candidum TaxID=119954 RepID=A0ACB9SKJ5_9MYRT|nr:hypothetical protein MLD38_001022 [Melastoma candidum]